MMKIHNRIKEERLKQGLSQKKLAENVGTSQQQIDLLEKSERKLSIDWMDKLAKGMGISPLNLLPEEWVKSNHVVGLDKSLLVDIIIAVNDILQGNLKPEEKARLVTILYEEYQELPSEGRKQKIIEFSKLYMKTKTA